MSGNGVRVVGVAACLGGLALLVVDLAPLASGRARPLEAVARVAAGTACHQRPARSFAVNGRPLSSCARCTGLHASGVAGGALILLLPWHAAARLPRPRVLVVAGLLPLAADVWAGLLVPGWDHPVLRALTGLVAGTFLLATLRAGPPVEELPS